MTENYGLDSVMAIFKVKVFMNSVSKMSQEILLSLKKNLNFKITQFLYSLLKVVC